MPERRSSDAVVRRKAPGESQDEAARPALSTSLDNQAVLRMMIRPGPAPAAVRASPAASAAVAPPRLDVSGADDPAERQAEQVADTVMRSADAAPPGRGADAEQAAPPGGSSSASGTVRRSCAGGGDCCNECREQQRPGSGIVQVRRSTPSGAPGPAAASPAIHDVLSAPGRPLDGPARGFMEPRFGLGLGHVRVHVDARADEAARAIHADAFSIGHQIVFAAGCYAPGTVSGRRLLAHELAHVVAQDGSPTIRRQQALGGSSSACPATRPAGEEASSKTGAGLLTTDVSFDRKNNKAVVADFPVGGASPPGGVTTEPDWERAMSVIAGTPSVGPTVGIFGFSDCIGSEGLNSALRQKRADAVLGLLPQASRAKVVMTQAEFSGNYLTGNDTAEQRARNRAVLIHITEPVGPHLSDACDMLTAAADLDQYFFLVRCVEKRLGRTTPVDAPVVLSLLRQIYYGSPGWTLPSGRNPVWDDVVTVRPWSPGTDPGPLLGKKLFDSLQASQTIKQNGMAIDLGHLLTGMDAARKPGDVTAHVGWLGLGTNVKNHEWATWAGDVGSAAAMSVLCTSFMTFPRNDAWYFTGGASDEDLDGDLDAYGMWAALNYGTPTIALQLDMTLSDALLDYYRTTKTISGKGRASRYEVFVNFYGGQVKGGVIGKPAELRAQLFPPVRDFAVLYFVNELKKALAGDAPDYCHGTPAPTAPGRTVPALGLLADVVLAADTMTARFVAWLTSRARHK